MWAAYYGFDYRYSTDGKSRFFSIHPQSDVGARRALWERVEEFFPANETGSDRCHVWRRSALTKRWGIFSGNETGSDRWGASPALGSCQWVACALARLVDELSERLSGLLPVGSWLFVVASASLWRWVEIRHTVLQWNSKMPLLCLSGRRPQVKH